MARQHCGNFTLNNLAGLIEQLNQVHTFRLALQVAGTNSYEARSQTYSGRRTFAGRTQET